jgi:hypothetical protein
MDPTDIDTIIRSLPALQKNLDLNTHFLKLLCSTPYKVFSEQMIADIMVNSINNRLIIDI